MANDKTFDQFTLTALSEIYISLHIFDLQEDTLYPIKTNQHIEMWSADFEGSQDKLRNVMNNITMEEHLELITEFTDLSTLEERMKGHKVISTVFKGKVNGWCKARFIAVDDDVNNRLRYVLYAVECIDEEKKKENHLLYLAQTDLMTGIFNRGHGEKMISELLAEQPEYKTKFIEIFPLFPRRRIQTAESCTARHKHIPGLHIDNLCSRLLCQPCQFNCLLIFPDRSR